MKLIRFYAITLLWLWMLPALLIVAIAYPRRNWSLIGIALHDFIQELVGISEGKL
jgi:hypothetical protein